MEDMDKPSLDTNLIKDLQKDLELIKAKDLGDIKAALRTINTKIDKISKPIETQSESIAELTKALCAAKLEATELTSSGKGIRGEYSTMDDLDGTFGVPLANNGLQVTFSLWEKANGDVILITTLLHTSGQWMKSISPIVPEESTISKNGYNQALKAATTYMKRNAYEALMGV